MRKTFLLLVLLCVSVDLTNCNGGSSVIGNALEPDYKYPWVVQDAMVVLLQGCAYRAAVGSDRCPLP